MLMTSSSMNIAANKAIAALKLGIRMIDEALSRSTVPERGPGSAKQLRGFRAELMKMLDDLESGSPGSQETPTRRIGHIIVDSWPIDSELGDILLRAENEYLAYISLFLNEIADKPTTPTPL